MLTIDWSETDADGWRDRIPMGLFAPNGRTPTVSYEVHGPNAEISVVKCSVDSEKNTSVLDYGGRHIKANADADWAPIALKLTFRDDARDEVIELRYRSEKGSKFVPAEAPFWMDEDDLALIEGGPKLVQHMRAERRPELARRKKDSMLVDKGHFECEACDVNLCSIYGDDAQACYEVHHDGIALAKRGVGITDLKRLKVLCANCHRAIHRTDPMMTVEAFRKRLKKI